MQLTSVASLLLPAFGSSADAAALSSSLLSAGFSGSACCSEFTETVSFEAPLLLLLLASELLCFALLGLGWLPSDVAWDTSVAASLMVLSAFSGLLLAGCLPEGLLAIDGDCLPLTTVDHPLLSGGG
jgi:hypothetical protein